MKTKTTKSLNQPAIPVKKRGFVESIKKDWSLYMFCLPGVILTFIFSYIPMYGVQIAFRRFNAKQGIWGSPWVGLRYFQRFIESPYFGRTITNTLILSLYGLLVSFPIPIILALISAQTLPKSHPDRYLCTQLYFNYRYVWYVDSVSVPERWYH